MLFLPFSIPISIYVTSFSSISYYSNSEIDLKNLSSFPNVQTSKDYLLSRVEADNMASTYFEFPNGPRIAGI